MSTPLIQVKDLHKIFESESVKTHVLKGVSFEIKKGEFVAIMGPSGSGKSTLMHILGLLDKASKGEYLLEGKNVTNLGDDELARLRNEKIGFVFQAFNLLARTTVLENVKLPLTYSTSPLPPLLIRRGVSDPDASGKDGVRQSMDERAKEVLKSVGLEHRLDYFTNQISGGEKQRVAIARALVNNPAVIFADEPTGNLDSKSGLQIMKILEDLNEAGHTIILVTHETYTAEHAKRIIKLKDGEITDDYSVGQRRRVEDGERLK
jgi:putative ABC transport system ATP-binding protein